MYGVYVYPPGGASEARPGERRLPIQTALFATVRISTGKEKRLGKKVYICT